MTPEAIRSQLVKLLPQLGTFGVDTLAPYLSQLTAKKGDVLVKQGASGADVYFLLSGTFSVFEKIQIDGKDMVLHTATFPGPGILGEVAVMSSSKRTATVVAMDVAECLVLTKDQFDGLVAGEPRLAIELLKAFGSLISDRQAAFQNKVRSNILLESSDADAGILRLSNYTGKASKVSEKLGSRLFSEDFKGVNYQSGQPKVQPGD